jgi:hypothetical protein
MSESGTFTATITKKKMNTRSATPPGFQKTGQTDGILSTVSVIG